MQENTLTFLKFTGGGEYSPRPTGLACVGDVRGASAMCIAGGDFFRPPNLCLPFFHGLRLTPLELI